ncbi:Photosystem I chlorophyll a apoprotein A2 [Capsicum chinense]|nr:Photosystem I chlorophyll a apoprotein A2 [Capsicum chinense]
MALRFPRFSQGLAQDPTTHRIWFGITTAYDFESHDDITEERLYQNIFASLFDQLVIIFLWTSGNLFHVSWQGNFESWVQNPLHVRPISHAIWDPHFGQPVVEDFTRAGALGPVNINYSGVYQWWLVTPITEKETEHFLVQKCRISSESSFVRTFWYQHMYSLPAYVFIAQDFTTQAALYTNHQYIAGFIMTGVFAHGAIFFIRDYNPEKNEDNVLARILDHKEAIISHLSWASLFLGFHTLILYVHNDVMLAFGTLEKQILIEPIFAQWIQSTHVKNPYGFDVLLSSTSGPAFNAGQSIWLSGWLNAINENSNSLFLTIGPGDFLVHHVITLGVHTITLILVKGALDARGSKLILDKKKDFDYSFPCDGPGRGGTCDISAM